MGLLGYDCHVMSFVRQTPTLTCGGADKSFARPTSRCHWMELSIIGKRGLFICQIVSLFLLQRLKGGTSGDARNFNSIETRAVIKYFFFCKARRPRKFTPF